MKEFRFNLQVTVYAETEQDARDTFCDDPGAWEIDEDDLTCVYIEDANITVEPPGESTTYHKTLVSTAASIMEGMSEDDRVDLLSEIAGDYCTDCGYKKYGDRCYCRDCS